MKNAGRFFSKIIPLIPVAFIGVVFFLLRKRLAGVFVPVFVAVVMAYMLDPLVDLVQKHMKLKGNKTRIKAVGIVFASSLIVLVVFVSFIVPVIISNTVDIMENTDDFLPKITVYIKNNISDEHGEIKQKILEITNSAAEGISSKIDSISDSASSFSLYSKVSGTLVGVITSIVFTYYFLRDKTMILNGIFGLFPYKWRKYVAETFNELGMISAKFIQGQLFVALIVGTLEMCGLFLLKMPYSVFFGIIGGVSNMIPYFGPFIGAVLPVVTALTISPSKALWVVALFLIVQQMDNHFISPRIIEGNLGIHPVTVIIILFIGQEFFGIWGIVGAVPVYAAGKCLLVRMGKLIYAKNIKCIEM